MFLHIHTKDGHIVLPIGDDFEESKHPRAKNGEFAKTAGGGKGAQPETHKIDVASTLAQPMQIGSAAIKKLQTLVKNSHGGEEKKQLQIHLAATYLKKHQSLTKKGSANAAKAYTQFKKFPIEIQQEAQKKLGIAPAAAKEPAKPASAPVGKATTAELEKAKSKFGLPNPMDLDSIKEFNKKYTGENTPTTEEGLKEKVAAFKQIQANLENEKKEKAKKEMASLGEAATHFQQLASLEEAGAGTAKHWIDIAASKIKANGVKDITPGEAAHIVAYSSNAYAQTNKALRAGVMDEARWAHVKELNKALEKLPPYVGVTKRGAILKQSDIALYKPGMVVEERGFMSTSKSKPWNGTKFVVHGKTGRDISKLSTHPGEAEVLFRSGTRFKVVSNDGDTIELREMD